MKKLFAISLLLVFICCPLCACKKSSKKATSSNKDFNLYFPTSIIKIDEREQKQTNEIIGKQQSYYSITFIADQNWTNDLFVNQIKFNISANKNADIDFIATLTTNGTETKIPLITTIKNGIGSVDLKLNSSLSGTTKIQLALTVPGGNGIDGLIKDKNNASNGFIWAIEKIIFEAEHK